MSIDSPVSLRHTGFLGADMCLAIPGEIVEITGTGDLERRGRVGFGGVFKEVNLAFVPEARVGDYVIVHVGVALQTVDQAEANRVFDYLSTIDELGELDIHLDEMGAKPE